MDTTWKGSAAGAPVREINVAPDVCPVCDAVTVRWHSIKGYPMNASVVITASCPALGAPATCKRRSTIRTFRMAERDTPGI